MPLTSRTRATTGDGWPMTGFTPAGSQARVPAGRMGRPPEIASLITYLCSEPAGYLTGNWIEVDGGLHRSAF